MEERENNQEFSFIKEKIKSKPINKRRLFKKVIWVIFCGILFGLISSLTFVIAKPKFEKLTEPKPDTTVSIPKDQEPEVEPEPEPDGNQDQAPGQSPEGTPNTEPVDEPEPEPEPVIVERELEASDYQILQNKLYAIGKKTNRSVVTVTGVTSDTDWFDSAYERENQASGVIIANNGQELLILTERKVIDNAEAINITFINEDEVPATLKKYDGNTGIAIISVALAEISEETMGKIDVAALGNSLTVNQGTVVIAVGSPLGINYAIRCGTVTASDNTISTWDSTYTVFTTDISGSAQGSGVLINLEGEIVGIMLQSYSNSGDQNTITALSVSELKGVIEALSNGKDIPYLGLKTSTVTDEISANHGLPKGVYIKGVETDLPSPAMNAGLQEGDVIVKINGEEVLTEAAYTQKLMALLPEQQVTLTLMRQSGEEYVELECTAVVSVLP